MDMAAMDDRRYSIDQQAGTISFVKDEHTRETQTERLDDVIEALMWLRSREKDLRRLVFDTFPLDCYERMHLVNGYYIGCAVEQVKGMGGTRGWSQLHRVKVKADDFEGELSRIERVAKMLWAERINERAQNGYVPIFDAQTGAIKNADQAKPVSEEDMPPYLWQEQQKRVWTPEYWQISEYNLDRHHYRKLP